MKHVKNKDNNPVIIIPYLKTSNNGSNLFKLTASSKKRGTILNGNRFYKYWSLLEKVFTLLLSSIETERCNND